MDKIKTVKIKNEDGTVSEESYSISVDATNVDMSNGKDLQDTIGNINIDTDGNIASQLKKIDEKINVSDIIDNLNTEQSNKPLSAKQGKELKKHIDSEWELYQPYLNEEMGSCVIIKKDDFVIMFDTAYIGQDSLLSSYLNSIGVNHVDVLMISHFHGDHAGCQQTILEDFCDKNTKIYIGMIPNYDLFTRDESHSKLKFQEFKTLCNQLGYTYEVPTNNSKIIINKINFRFLNTDTSYLTDYYASYSDTNINNYQQSTINNISLVCELTIGGSKILLTGDIEQTAQTKIKSYIQEVDLMQIPHHNYNMYGDFEFFNNANPKLAFANRGTTAQNFFPYFSRYSKFVKNTRIIQNLNVNIKIQGIYNHMEVIEGVDFITGFDDNTKAQLLTFIPSVKHCLFSEVNLYDFSLWDSDYILDIFANYSDREGFSVPFYRGGRYTALENDLNNLDPDTTHTQYTLNINLTYMEFTRTPFLYVTYRIYRSGSNNNQKYVQLIPNAYANKELTGNNINTNNVYYRQNFVATVSDAGTQNTYEVPVYKINSTLNNQKYIGYWQNLSGNRYLTFMKVDITIKSNGYDLIYYRVVYDLTNQTWSVYNTSPELIKIKI